MTDTRADRRAELRRLFNPTTGQYLHLSTTSETRGTAYAWSGTHAQARRLQERAQADGQAWPYRIAPLTEKAEA